jgi:hypothetical protein
MANLHPIAAAHESSPITGQVELNRLNVELVLIPPGGSEPDDRDGYNVMTVVDMGHGFRLALVSLGLSDELAREIDRSNNRKAPGSGLRWISYEEREQNKIDGLITAA